MAPIAAELRAAAAGRVIVREVPAAALVTHSARAHAMDIATMAPADQDFSAEVLLPALGAPAGGDKADADNAGGAGGAGGGVMATCVVLWFDCEFSPRFCPECPVTLTTAPDAAQTHWMQAVLPLRAPVALPPGGALAVRVSMARSAARHRALDVSLEYGVAGPGGAPPPRRDAASFSMGVGGE
jgi:hypothetical protein